MVGLLVNVRRMSLLVWNDGVTGAGLLPLAEFRGLDRRDEAGHCWKKAFRGVAETELQQAVPGDRAPDQQVDSVVGDELHDGVVRQSVIVGDDDDLDRRRGCSSTGSKAALPISLHWVISTPTRML
jgi:hypothetical protein